MKVRSVTCFVPLTYPLDKGDTAAMARFLHAARRMLEDAGLEVQTVRLATPPFTEVLGDPAAAQVVDLAQALEELCVEQGIDYISIGPLLAAQPDTLLAPIYRLPDMFAASERIFATVEVAAAGRGINLAAVRASAEIVPRIAQATPRGFGTLRFAALANCPPGSPFFPVAYHGGGPPTFAFATESADLPVTAFGQAATLEEARARLIDALETSAARLAAVADRLVDDHNLHFSGIDFSLATYPDQAISIGTAVERLGVDRFGVSGTLFAAAFIADCLRQANYPHCGYSGLMFPVLEDSVLAARADEHLYTVDSLLLYSTVCGAGLDTVPLPGDVGVDELAGMILDVATLAVVLDKPLSARLMPVPGLTADQRTTFDFAYFENAPVLPTKGSGIARLLSGNQFVALHGRT